MNLNPMLRIKQWRSLLFGACFSAVLLLPGRPAHGQTDSAQIFTLSDFFQQVMEFHPVARQAALLPEQARQEIRIARSLFDPALSSKFARKEFKDADYYTYWDNVLQVPTWLGVDVKAGYERNTGPYLNRDKLVPENGLTYVGLSVPLAQGLLIDERRATLQQAKLFAQMAEAERISQVNKLLLQAAKDYWDWAYFYNKLQLHRQGVELASFRFGAVRERANAGDLAAIDTVEALIEVQNRQVMLRQSEVEYQNSHLILSNHIWRDNDEPVELSRLAIPFMREASPAAMPPAELQDLLANATANHPELLKLQAKHQQLEVDRRLYINKLLPKLNVNYNVLQTGAGINSDAFSQSYFQNNYKMGVSFSYPLFLRNERGRLQLTKLKMQDNTLERRQVNRVILAGVQAAYNEMVALQYQIEQQERLVENARTLRNGEATRFQNGESSLFLINTREISLISQEVKLYEMQTKYAKSRTLLQWSAGAVAP